MARIWQQHFRSLVIVIVVGALFVGKIGLASPPAEREQKRSDSRRVRADRSHEAEDRIREYSTSCVRFDHDPSTTLVHTVLMVPTRNVGSPMAYSDSLLALEIESVHVDGSVVDKRASGGVDGGESFDPSKRIRAIGDMHMYSVLMELNKERKTEAGDPFFVLVALTKMDNSGVELSEFHIPEHWTDLTIRYRPRYPSGNAGATMIAHIR